MKTLAVMTAASLLAVSMPAEAGVPLDRVQSAVAAVIEIVTRPDLQGPAKLVARRALLREVADDLFDFQEMARSSLGYHWATPSERERAEFLVLFTDLLERSYVTTIENYAGERVIYLSETIEGDYATVRSKILTTRGAEIGVDYRLRRSAAGWSAFDVVLEHVSLAANYREQINRVLRTTSFATLLARMRAGQLAAVAIPRGAGRPR
ncbi:MAG TPA: ABC transporter substrate-binding protein [Methylomirabilota bacterium]|jgi:phospholipid transport system substrate-binding protein|nr:ABC transporter substrate-binding protein [Methylomirabilota bacterium]